MCCGLWWLREGIHTREDAKIWMIQHQLARRNLQPYQRAELALQLEPLLAAQAKANQGTRTDIPPTLAESFTPVDTREELAKAAGVSHDTIRKAKVIAQTADERMKAELRRG